MRNLALIEPSLINSTGVRFGSYVMKPKSAPVYQEVLHQLTHIYIVMVSLLITLNLRTASQCPFINIKCTFKNSQTSHILIEKIDFWSVTGWDPGAVGVFGGMDVAVQILHQLWEGQRHVKKQNKKKHRH